MDSNAPRTASDHTFEEIEPIVGEGPSQHLAVDDLKRVKLPISAHLGSCTMLVRDVLQLRRGSVVRLDKLAGEMTDIYVSNLPLARGEVVVIGDVLHVRVGEIVGQELRSEGEEEPV